MPHANKVLTDIIDSAGFRSVELLQILDELKILKAKIDNLPTETRYDRLKYAGLSEAVNDAIRSIKEIMKTLTDVTIQAQEAMKKVNYLNNLIELLHQNTQLLNR